MTNTSHFPSFKSTIYLGTNMLRGSGDVPQQEVRNAAGVQTQMEIQADQSPPPTSLILKNSQVNPPQIFHRIPAHGSWL